jgi:hypothetical protein
MIPTADPLAPAIPTGHFAFDRGMSNPSAPLDINPLRRPLSVSVPKNLTRRRIHVGFADPHTPGLQTDVEVNGPWFNAELVCLLDGAPVYRMPVQRGSQNPQMGGANFSSVSLRPAHEGRSNPSITVSDEGSQAAPPNALIASFHFQHEGIFPAWTLTLACDTVQLWIDRAYQFTDGAGGIVYPVLACHSEAEGEEADE